MSSTAAQEGEAGSMITASLAVIDGFVTRRIVSGEVKVEGVQTHVSVLHPSELFWRQLRFAEFDISELSLSSLMIAHANGDRTWTALPIFTTRRFFHTEVLVREDAGISSPSDLAGRRVGVPEFQQTAAVWARGALLHEFGVDQSSIHWFMERNPERSHAGATGSRSVPDLKLDTIPPGASLASALGDGFVDAALHYVAGKNIVDRSSPDVSDLVGVRPLFSDPMAEGVRYFKETGILPMNHCVVVRTSLLEKNPWIALNLFDAFVQAKERALRTFRQDVQPFVRIGQLSSAAVKHDPLPFGLASEGHLVELLSSYLCEQGLTDRKVALGELFASTTLAI
jgi:4,5-dihydroxyphthalate decarboxylase